MKRSASVEGYIESADQWQDELVRLREILLSTELAETVKWGAPCYTFEDKNVVGMGAFKSYCGLWFFQGALLSDPQKVLINAQEGKTKALRQWRFESKTQIKVRPIKTYVAEAIRLHQQGLEIKPEKAKSLIVPRELKAALSANKKAKAGFAGLTQGKQREYAEYISTAKRDETKVKRLEKIIPMIIAGVGLNDKYRNC